MSLRTPKIHAGSRINLFFLLLFTFIGLVSAACAPIVQYGVAQYATEQASRRATLETETALTNAYGIEVSQVIERFERTWHSFTAYQNPAMQREVATDRMIAYAGVARMLEIDDQKWIITRAATVGKVQVLEYDSNRFKAIACVNLNWGTVNKEGVALEPDLNMFSRRVYVFVREQAQWKDADFIDITDPDAAALAWRENAEEWEKELMGEPPHDIDPSCWANSPTATPSR